MFQSTSSRATDYTFALPENSVAKDRETIRHLPITGEIVLAEAKTQWAVGAFTGGDLSASSSSPDTQTVFLGTANESEFVDTWSSSIVFKIKVTSPCVTGVYMNGFHDVIKDICIEAANGTEIERITDLNTLNAFISDSVLGRNFRETSLFATKVGTTSPTKFNPSVAETASVNNQPYLTVDPDLYSIAERQSSSLSAGYKTGKTHHVIVPLCMLGGLFKMDTLMPPQLFNGMKITITWADASDVFTHNTDPNRALVAPYVAAASPNPEKLLGNIGNSTLPIVDPSYELTDIMIEADTYSLSDSAHKSVSTQFARNGLGISFRSYMQFDKQKRLGAVGDVEMLRVTRGFSQATKFLGAIRCQPTDSKWKSFFPLTWFHPHDESFDYITEHNGKRYPRNLYESSVSRFWAWQQAFGANKILYNSDRALYNDYMKNYGHVFAHDFNRTSKSLMASTPCSNFSTNNSNSAQTIDGNNPATVSVVVPSLTSPDYVEALLPTDAHAHSSVGWVCSTWVEHFRHLSLKPNMTEVFM